MVGCIRTLGLVGTEDSLLIRDMGVLITAGSTVYHPGIRIDTRYTDPANGQGPFKIGQGWIARQAGGALYVAFETKKEVYYARI